MQGKRLINWEQGTGISEQTRVPHVSILRHGKARTITSRGLVLSGFSALLLVV